MTNPFTAFAFEASGTGVNTNRTMPARIADIHNVLDFGADPTGVTDSWAAITACLNHGQITLVTTAVGSGNTLTFSSVPASVVAGMYVVDVTTPSALPDGTTVQSTTSGTVTVNNSTTSVQSGDTITFNLNVKGTIFFPPGTYKVTQSIDFSSNGIQGVGFLGVLGASTVTGNFADYIFKRSGDSGNSGYHVVEKLTVINTNATGGGIVLGNCVGGAVRDCVVTANQGIRTSNLTNNLGSLEIIIKNCQLDPGSNTSGSIGLMLEADGPAINCYMHNFAKGAICWGNEGGQSIHGCFFDTCTIGYDMGIDPSGSSAAITGGALVQGCHFKNCGTAINDRQGSNIFCGVYIEGTNGQAPGGTDPQYGIFGNNSNEFFGVTVTGQYAQFGIYFPGDQTQPATANMYGVSSTNSGAGSAWGSGTGTPVSNLSHIPRNMLIGCNTAQLTQAGMVIFSSPITSLTWSSGTATLTFAFGNLSGQTGESFTIVVSGVTTVGYNGTFTGTITGVNTLTYPVAGPLGNDSTGNVTVNIAPLSEGDCFNVTDSSSSTWGAIAVGGGSTHAKVRYNGAGGSLTVVGI